MISVEDVGIEFSKPTEDARDLQLRLYREIGISAVAAALNVGADRRDPVIELQPTDIPAVLRGDDLAA